MMSTTLYSVDFRNGNLSPASSHPWGPMVRGHSAGPLDHAESFGDPQGLNLGVYRAPVPGGKLTTRPSSARAPAVWNTVYAIPGLGVLPLESRLRILVEFDLPRTNKEYIPLLPWGSAVVVPAPAGIGILPPEPWALGLQVKLGNENDIVGEPGIGITCQFNRNSNADGTVGGVRLNSPGSQPTPASVNIDSPLDYKKYRGVKLGPLFLFQTIFKMEFVFSGIGALPTATTQPMPAIGYGALDVLPGVVPFARKRSVRLFTNASLSNGQTYIGAIGISLVTLDGEGQIMIRLRSFSVEVL